MRFILLVITVASWSVVSSLGVDDEIDVKLCSSRYTCPAGLYFYCILGGSANACRPSSLGPFPLGLGAEKCWYQCLINQTAFGPPSPSPSPSPSSSPPSPVSSPLPAPPGGVPQPTQTLIWSDEFNGASLDANSWSPMLGE